MKKLLIATAFVAAVAANAFANEEVKEIKLKDGSMLKIVNGEAKHLVNGQEVAVETVELEAEDGTKIHIEAGKVVAK